MAMKKRKTAIKRKGMSLYLSSYNNNFILQEQHFTVKTDETVALP